MQPVIRIVLREDKQKVEAGKTLYPIVLQVYHKGQRKQQFTGFYVEAKNFIDGVVVKQGNASYLNTIITQQKNELEKKLLDQQINTGAINLKSQAQNRKKFFDYATDLYKGMSNRCTPQYISRCLSVMEDFKSFAGDVSFQAVTNQVLKKYEDHLFARGLARNTINRMFKRIKQVFAAAEVHYTYKAVTYKQSKREYLTLDEIEKIEKKGRDHAVKWYFLLSCYTGLRYSDMTEELKVTRNKGVKRLILSTVKTGEVVSIKINDKVEKILSRLKEPIPVNVHCNRILKDIAADAELGRNVNFHMGRHSFAVNAASLGFPIEVVSKLLGHSSIRTTAIYYKITDTKVDEWMDKWG